MIWKDKVSAEIEANRSILEHLGLTIGNNPELGFEEFQASQLLADTLQGAGFHVVRGIAGLKTAFEAKLGGVGPNIALLCEYDALPELGHACGHNLIGMASVGAALGLAPFLKEIGGTVTVLGAPAEETGGGKVILVEQGAFHQVDAALMFHPSSQNLLMSTTNALDAYEFVFTGKVAHAAASPEQGINALDGLIFLFTGINALREHLPESVRIHGIITEGGTAPNIVPHRAVGRFYLRAPKRELLDEVTAKVRKIAEGAALMSGASVSWSQFELANDNLVPNQAMALAFGANLQHLGVTEIQEFLDGKGSSDMGNVSKVVPAIHPYLNIGDGLAVHTLEFAEASVSAAGISTAILAAKALAHTVIDLLTNTTLLEAVKREHAES